MPTEILTLMRLLFASFALLVGVVGIVTALDREKDGRGDAGTGCLYRVMSIGLFVIAFAVAAS